MFVPKCPIDNIPSLVQIMAWRRPGNKPLSEPMFVRLPTHICVTRPQWVNCMYVLQFNQSSFFNQCTSSIGSFRHIVRSRIWVCNYIHIKLLDQQKYTKCIYACISFDIYKCTSEISQKSVLNSNIPNEDWASVINTIVNVALPLDMASLYITS